ncbi:hypothetical protein OL548_33720 (plasmid) [Lysinibacillus sp. MHQ-1]|nr:hypothetical protein OL548_33720 [Lysinibacillus sp. MHQ-1]
MAPQLAMVFLAMIKKRVIRDEGKGVYSTVPHYNTDDQKLKNYN